MNTRARGARREPSWLLQRRGADTSDMDNGAGVGNLHRDSGERFEPYGGESGYRGSWSIPNTSYSPPPEPAGPDGKHSIREAAFRLQRNRPVEKRRPPMRVLGRLVRAINEQGAFSK